MPKTKLAVVLAFANSAASLDAHAGAPRHPEYQRTWEDGALRTSVQKGLKGKTRAPTSGLPTGKRQYKPASITKPIDK